MSHGPRRSGPEPAELEPLDVNAEELPFEVLALELSVDPDIPLDPDLLLEPLREPLLADPESRVDLLDVSWPTEDVVPPDLDASGSEDLGC